ncbi:hypothetical protein Tco_1271392 [Tanacetum coccineum]
MLVLTRESVLGVFVYFGVMGKSGDAAPLLHDGSTDGTKLRRDIPGRIVGAPVVMDVGGEEHDGGNGGWKSSMMNFVIMEYMVKISKKARILELKRRHLKKLTLSRIHQGRYGVFVPALHKIQRGFKINTPYPKRVYTPYSI